MCQDSRRTPLFETFFLWEGWRRVQSDLVFSRGFEASAGIFPPWHFSALPPATMSLYWSWPSCNKSWRCHYFKQIALSLVARVQTQRIHRCTVAVARCYWEIEWIYKWNSPSSAGSRGAFYSQTEAIKDDNLKHEWMPGGLRRRTWLLAHPVEPPLFSIIT